MHPISFSRLSIRQRLPILITALLLSILLVFGLISYLGIRNAELTAGVQRLETSSLQLSSMLSSSTHNLSAAVHAQANEPAVKAWMASGGKDSTKPMENLLDRLKKDTSWLGFALLNAGYKPLYLFARRDSSKTLFDHFEKLPALKKDSGVVGDIFLLGDRVCYPVAAQVWNRDTVVGYLVKWKSMQTRSSSVDQVKQLIGLGAKFYVGNADSSLWTDMLHRVPLPPYLKAGSGTIHYRYGGEQMLASVRSINNSNWLVSVEFTQKHLLQTSESYLYLLLVTASLLLASGIFFGWLMSRNISRPLTALTAAASRIAAGEEYASLVAVHRYDEIGKLARSFNAMSIQVRSSREKLRKEADYYKLLFENNPMPMWIMSLQNLGILDVNKSTLTHYGYTREEFLELNARDLRPPEDVELFLQGLQIDLQRIENHGTWRHQKKDGTVIMVEIISNYIFYQSQPARLVLANDITERLRAETELIHHRVMQQQVITETTLMAQEKEREEIGRELHDNINQILASTKLYLELAQKGGSELIDQAVSRSYNNINLVIGEIRKLSKQLVKPAFDTSLKEALKDMTGELQALAVFTIEFCHEQLNEELVDEGIRLMIYRIVQEQLNNILKHATASHIRIELKTDQENVHLLIKDNGVGFDVRQKSGGIGLRNIEHRVRFHKGTVSIDSKPGAGCTIQISVPLKKESSAAKDWMD